MNVFNNLTLLDEKGKYAPKHKVPTTPEVEMRKGYKRESLFALLRKKLGKEE